MQGFDTESRPCGTETHQAGCGKIQIGIPKLRWPACLEHEDNTSAGCSKRPSSDP
jgi:hypothetical protein